MKTLDQIFPKTPPLIGIGNLPVLEKSSSEKRSHLCAKATLFTVGVSPTVVPSFLYQQRLPDGEFCTSAAVVLRAASADISYAGECLLRGGVPPE